MKLKLIEPLHLVLNCFKIRSLANQSPQKLFIDAFLGSGPDRGRSPVEWAYFLYVNLFVCLFVSPHPLGHPAGLETQPARPQAWLDGTEGGRDECTDEHMYGKYPHTTGLFPLLGPMPCSPLREPRRVEQGKGTADHLMPLGDWFPHKELLLD